ncbi:MAG: zinc ribbon domain-containing protein, partial [Eubacterium sp.]|nr:zinc ribbon domain-containing protein [Eubacterium sp.]
NCGTKCEESQRFCPNCGAALTAAAQKTVSGANTVYGSDNKNISLKLSILRKRLVSSLPLPQSAAVYIENIPDVIFSSIVERYSLCLEPGEVLAVIDEQNNGKPEWLFTDECFFVDEKIMPYSGNWTWKDENMALFNKLFSDLHRLSGGKYYSAVDGLAFCMKMGGIKWADNYEKLGEELKKACDPSTHKACNDLVTAIKESGIIKTLRSSVSADEIYSICYNNLYRKIVDSANLKNTYDTDSVLLACSPLAGGKGERIRTLIKENHGKFMKEQVAKSTKRTNGCLGCWGTFALLAVIGSYMNGESIGYCIIVFMVLCCIGAGVDYLLHKKGKFIS